MSFEPDATQRLLLWRLAVSEEGGEFLKDIESNFTPAKRRPLIREGLMEEDKRRPGGTGRPALYLELTDKGWAWCQHHLTEEIRPRGVTPKLAVVVLNRLLHLMSLYFESQDHTVSFGQFIQQTRREPTSPEATGNGQVADLQETIRRACLELGNGQENVRVRLADLRSRLNGVPRPVLDQQLLAMECAGQLSLYHLDNPQELRPEDREAVLRTSAGNERHIIYFGGRGS